MCQSLGRELQQQGCPPHFPAGEVHVDLNSERQRLLERDAEWAALSSAGQDVERILSFWTDDALVYPPGMPPVSGKAALRSYVQGALAIPGFHITWSSSEASLSPDGQLAYVLSTNAVTLPDPTGQLVTIRGRAVTVWRRPAGGEWQCAVDIWNEGPGGQ
jgi:ketosteroid isomerase-like protein